ncbi:hypothetical protein ACC691_36640, partial [Rhizobium johnstonii]|uniref:hypothetical protein n=1 Tax=Rhizobium johnstonii TaxID=3019933 RepID=UPI003F99E9CB
AITSGVLGIIVFIVGYLLSYGDAGRAWLRRVPLGRQILDIGALSFAHGVVALLLWLVSFRIIQDAFIDAVVFPLPAAVLVGAVSAVSSYFIYLSASGMTTSRVATVMVIFQLLGMITSMLSASDPHWWQENI